MKRKGWTARKRTCRAPGCRVKFFPQSSFHWACCPGCAIEMVKAKKKKDRVKADKIETRRMRDKLKTRGQHLKEAQAEFNKYTRLRDDKDPCISCQKFHPGQYHAGHYLTTSARPDLRFDERNCHKQCAPCNNHLSGNIQEYRKHLIRKIGEDQVVDMETGLVGRADWSIDEIMAIRQLYKVKFNALRKAGSTRTAKH